MEFKSIVNKLDLLRNPIPKERIVNVAYGRGTAQGGGVSGKLYTYRDKGGGQRVGNEVVVDVTNKQGKTYKTLATVVTTRGAGTYSGMKTKELLESRGIPLKDVRGGSQSQLPGYQAFAHEKAPTEAWRKHSHEKKGIGMAKTDHLGNVVGEGRWKTIR